MATRGRVNHIRSPHGGRHPHTESVWRSLMLFGLSALLASCQADSRGFVSTGPGTALAATGSGQTAGRPAGGRVIPRGTAVAVRIIQAIGTHPAGQQEYFDGILAEAIVVDGCTLIPAGGRIRGRVHLATGRVTQTDPEVLSLGLDSIEIAEGEWIYVKTTSVTARQGDQVNHGVVPPAVGQETVLFAAQSRLVFTMREDQTIDR